jgi:hypothetical protein
VTFEQLIEIVRGLQNRVMPERVREVAEKLLACGTVVDSSTGPSTPRSTSTPCWPLPSTGEPAAVLPDIGRFMQIPKPARRPKR